VTGKAVERCALKLRDDIIALGAQMLEVDKGLCDFDGEKVCFEDKEVSLTDIAYKAMVFNNEALKETVSHSSKTSPPPFMAGACELEIDPDTGEVLPEGEQGELVFTAIDKEAFPMIRYRTKDICRLTREKCSCGRTHVRMAKPMGRSDDMLIIRGVNVFPSEIETVLLNNGYAANYQIVVDRVNNTDTLDVQVEMTPEMFNDNVGEVEERQKKLMADLKSMLGIKAKVSLLAPKSIARSEGKAVRVIDKRKI